MHIGILGGTFDPPHLAHLHTGEVAYRQLGLDLIMFMPAGAPWQKAGRRVSPPPDRWEMTRRAVEGVDYFVADDREVHRDGWTYTADTLAGFDGDTDITLILGADAARNLSTWNRAEEVLTRVRLAVAPRPGTPFGAVEDSLADDLSHPVSWLNMVPLDISGTAIRNRVGEGRSVRFLVRDSVWTYMIEQGLYARDEASQVP